MWKNLGRRRVYLRRACDWVFDVVGAQEGIGIRQCIAETAICVLQLVSVIVNEGVCLCQLSLCYCERSCVDVNVRHRNGCIGNLLAAYRIGYIVAAYYAYQWLLLGHFRVETLANEW